MNKFRRERMGNWDHARSPGQHASPNPACRARRFQPRRRASANGSSLVGTDAFAGKRLVIENGAELKSTPASPP
jgi:hypothetical protein